MQPSLPELPPMKPVETSAPPPPSFAPPASGKAPSIGAKRLRQIIGVITGGGLTLVIVVVFFQLVARPGLRPSDLMATIEAQTELGVMNQKMGAAPGAMTMTEAQYQEAIAKAQRDGQAKAELSYQRDLAVVQADKERVVAAYQTLYQRANLVAQAALQMENVAQQFRQRLLEMTNGGRNVVIMVKDFACGLGDAEACASARHDREVIITESDELSRGDVGKHVQSLMADIDDPATLIAREDQRNRGTPALPR